MNNRSAIERVLPGTIFVLSLMATCVLAYDTPTHFDYLTQEAADQINVLTNNAYGEFNIYESTMAQGSFNEDIGVQSLQHFYRPTDGSGLFGVFASARSRLQNQNYFASAIASYQSGNKSIAYASLGKTLHLATQDMFAVQHVFNNAHLNNVLGIPIDFSPEGYETWVSSNRIVFVGNTARYFQTLTPVTGSADFTLDSDAKSTYQAVRLPGALVVDFNNPALGPLGLMFPPRYAQAINLNVGVNPITLLPEFVWNIPNVGNCRQFSGLVGNPGIFDDWWAAQNFPGETGSFFYIQNVAAALPSVYKDGSPTNGANLAQLYAFDKEGLLQKSQAASAGMMVQFAKIVDNISPQVTVMDSVGNVPDGGTISDTSLTLTASDPIDAGHPTASGIYRIVVNGPTASTKTYTGLPDGQSGPDTKQFTLSLSSGSYTVTVYDGLGNQSVTHFTVTGGACSTNPNSQACQTACATGVPGACQQACNANPVSVTCTQHCFNSPSDPVCLQQCASNSSLPYCQPSCSLQPASPACINLCQTNPSAPQCPTLCAQNAVYCPPGGGPGGPPTITPGSGNGLPTQVTPGCDPPLTFTFRFNGSAGDCFNIIGGPSGCLSNNGSTVITFQLTGTHIGDNFFSAVLTNQTAGTSTRQSIVIHIHGCAPDPTFLGGNPFPFTLPPPASPLVDAFSPGVPGSPRQTFQTGYTVFGSGQAEVIILAQDASGALVRTLVPDQLQSPGPQTLTWDGKNDQGVLLPPGVYTFTVAQRSLANLTQVTAFSGLVAIDNTPPTASISAIQVSTADPTVLNILGTASDPYLKSYQIERATSSAGPWTLTALASPGSGPTAGSTGGQTPVLATVSRSLFLPGPNFLRLTVTSLSQLQSQALTNFTISASTAGLTGVPVQIVTSSQTLLNPGGNNPPADNPNIFVEDSLPTQGTGNGGQNLFNWTWVASPVYSGSAAHTDTFAASQPGARLHYFIQASPGRTLAVGENIIQYVFLDPASPPQEVLLGFYTGSGAPGGDGEHRVYGRTGPRVEPRRTRHTTGRVACSVATTADALGRGIGPDERWGTTPEDPALFENGCFTVESNLTRGPPLAVVTTSKTNETPAGAPVFALKLTSHSVLSTDNQEGDQKCA